MVDDVGQHFVQAEHEPLGRRLRHATLQAGGVEPFRRPPNLLPAGADREFVNRQRHGRPGLFVQASAAFSASAPLLKIGISWSTPVASRLIRTVEPSFTTSAILPPRCLTALALAISAPMPIEARNLTADRSTTTAFFGAAVRSTSFEATESV